MQRLYVAAHLPDAWLVRSLLTAAGIRTHLFNEYAQGGLGDLPAASVYPEIWLDEERDLERARRIIEGYEKKQLTGGSQRCPACGEDNPRSFGICWNCQQPFPP